MSDAYTLPHSQPGEPARLRLMGMLLDPFTRRIIQSLGLAPGWSCLEVGSGLGTVSQWLSGQLGQTGQVICSDLSTDLLDGMAAHNLQLKALDITQDELPSGQDLVLARAVLHHLRHWDTAALPRLVASLKPGGVLLLIEPDFSPGCNQPATFRFWQSCIMGSLNVGIDMLLGSKLPPKLVELGLERVSGEAMSPHFNGGSPWAEYWQRSMDVLKAGFSGPLLDELVRFRELFSDPSFWTQVCAFTAVWGYRSHHSASAVDS